MTKTKRPGVDFMSLYDNKKWIGLLYVISESDLSYVFYFTISQSERRQGYGSHVLQTVKEFYKNQRLCHASEENDETAANYQQRVKRKEFYEKNGFPNLHCNLREGKVIYDMLGIGKRYTSSILFCFIQRYTFPIYDRIL
ncbi:MAG: GNAT family N-acetyltransferase [Lachnospiraceae bacterium]|nr:GNAT family N-acetyltransferase [Lachnospiraceae bacterium]